MRDQPRELQADTVIGPGPQFAQAMERAAEAAEAEGFVHTAQVLRGWAEGARPYRERPTPSEMWIG